MSVAVADLVLVRRMRASRPAAIVADGRERILMGSAREARFRMLARLMRRSQSIRERANLFGRAVVRFRIWRFIHRQMEKRAPRGACYSTPLSELHLYLLRSPSMQPHHTSNQAMQPTASPRTASLSDD